MASYNGTVAAHATLTANTEDTVTLSPNYRYVRVFNRAATGDIFLTTDGTTAASVAGAETFVVPAGQYVDLPNRKAPSEPALAVANNTVVRLICATANAYSVVGL